MRYLLLAAAATALFFGAYWLLMRSEKRHTMVRFYLVGTLVLSLLLPAVHLRLAVPAHYVARSEAAVSLSGYSSDSRLSSESRLSRDSRESSAAGSRPSLPLWQWVWLAGVAVATVVLAVRLAVLWRRMRSLPFEERDGLRVALLDDDTPAYSFGRRIVVGTRGFTDNEVQQLVGHESVHARRCHTADLLLCEAAKVVLWFDPFTYLYARELKRVHEYIADGAMMSADYAALFYHQVSGRQYVPLANQFDYRMVHQRIAMMSKRRRYGGWLKPLAALPIVAVVLLAACAPKSNSLLVGQWEYVGISREFIYDDGDTDFHIKEDDPDNTYPRINDLDFHADGTATVIAWDVSKWVTDEDDDSTKILKPGDYFDYTPYAVEWQVVADTLLMCNDKGGREAFCIVNVDEDTLVFVSSSIFRLQDRGEGHTRETYTFRRKK
ncbi:MAG: hypothetical protein IJ524_01860 [Bacteroidales bacterium]|nr:hypothetical protein [Bacteroidales bacterium]